MWNSLISAVLVLGSAAFHSRCDEAVNYIVGGEEISAEDAPYQAVILYKFKYFCGGTIIAPVWILTTARCLLLPNGSILGAGLLRVRVGTEDANIAYRNNDYDVGTVIRHPNFKPETFNFNVGLLKVKRRFAFEDRIRCIEMAPRGTPVPYDEQVTVTGFGSIDPTRPPRDAKLRTIDVTILSQDVCTVHYIADPEYHMTNRMFCAAGNGRDACKYDAGGPAVYQNKVIGIISHGRDCAFPDFPGIYTNVASVRGWIDAVIKANTQRLSNGLCLAP